MIGTRDEEYVASLRRINAKLGRNRPMSGIGLDEADIAAWREASSLTVAAIEGVTLTVDALLLLAAQCVASAATALGDVTLAIERTHELAEIMATRMSGQSTEPVRILLLEDAPDASA